MKLLHFVMVSYIMKHPVYEEYLLKKDEYITFCNGHTYICIMDHPVHAFLLQMSLSWLFRLYFVDYLKYWISSIKTYSVSERKGLPIIILLGTHLDQIPEVLFIVDIRYRWMKGL